MKIRLQYTWHHKLQTILLYIAISCKLIPQKNQQLYEIVMVINWIGLTAFSQGGMDNLSLFLIHVKSRYIFQTYIKYYWTVWSHPWSSWCRIKAFWECQWSRYVQPTFPSYFHAQKTFIKSFYHLTRSNTKNVKLAFLQWTIKLRGGERTAHNAH